MAETSSAQSGNGLGQGILIVDDEPLICRLLQQLLDLSRIPTWTAHSGAEAVEAYERHSAQIGLVLLDVNMPVVDGPAIWKLLRQINPQVRCAFMTGSGGSLATDSLLAQGAACILFKPFKLGEVVDSLKAALRVSREAA